MKRLCMLLSVMVCLFFVAVMVAPARADEPARDAEGYEKVNGAMMQPGESIPASRLVAGAYGFIFAAVAVYVATIAARTRRLEEEMDTLKRKLESKAS